MQSYIPSKKVWLNSKYIKTKRNHKLENKFFGSFQVLHLIVKQAYKLDLRAKWRIYEVFHVSLLDQDTIRKGRSNKLLELETKQELDVRDDKKYKDEAICKSEVYAKDATGQLLKLYYLVS